MKPDNTIRITVDYKRLNNVIEFDPYPMPDASEMYKELADKELCRSSWFSKFDFFKAYHQIPVSPECIKFTAFICEWGLFEYPSMPLGIKTAAAWFQRCIDITFSSLIVKGSLRGFLDDMVLFSRNLQDHLVDSLELIKIMKEATLKVSLKKCELAQEEVTFLDKVISRNRVKNCPKKAECIRNMPLAISYKSLQSALGIFNYQRPFIYNYAEHAQPLYDMLEVMNVPKKFIKSNGLVNGKFALNWIASQISQFELKKKLTSDLLELFHPDFRYPMNARSDTSDKGYGGYVFQDIDGQRRVLGYMSRTYTRAQRNYSVGERELLSIYKLIEEFHIILFGRHFTIYTDHLPLTFLFAKTEPSKRLQRWFETLASYSFTIKYIPGAENTVADALSRLYDDVEVPETAFSDEDFNDIIIANLQQEPSDIVNILPSPKIDLPLASILIAALNSSQEDFAYEAHRQQQLEDPDISWIISVIKEHGEERPDILNFQNSVRRQLYKDYTSLNLVDEILFFESEDPLGRNTLKYVLPSQLRDSVFFSLHNTVYGGHLGRKRTKHKLLERFYRPFLARDIIGYLKCCEVCQKIKTLSRKTKAEMLVMRPEATNQIIASDFAGPFNKSRRGNVYIQIITDLFSKYTLIVAQPNKEAATAAKCIVEKWCCVFGTPLACLTDQGREYQSKLWDALCELWDIERLKTTPYHPEADGQSEKRVHTTKTMITAFVNQSTQDDWDEFLPHLAFAYNSGIHHTTNHSSFEAMFGRTPRLPIDLVFPVVNKPTLVLESDSDFSTTNVHNITSLTKIKGLINLPEHRTVLKPDTEAYLTSLKLNLKRIGVALTTNRNLIMDKAKRKFDRRIKKEFYKVGDLVLCSHPKVAKGLRRGIAYKYQGPFQVVGVDPNGCNYSIRKEGPRQKVKRVHKNNLKAFFSKAALSPVLRINKKAVALPLVNVAEKPNIVNNLVPQPDTHSENSSSESEKPKRIYRKNPNNPRWKPKPISKQTSSNSDRTTDVSLESETRHEDLKMNKSNLVNKSGSTSDSSSSETIRPRRLYRKNPNIPRWQSKPKIKPISSSSEPDSDTSSNSDISCVNSKKPFSNKRLSNPIQALRKKRNTDDEEKEIKDIQRLIMECTEKIPKTSAASPTGPAQTKKETTSKSKSIALPTGSLKMRQTKTKSKQHN